MTASLSAPALNHADLLNSNLLITGPTGTGKTHLVKRHILHLYTRGHQIHLVDTAKRDYDYRDVLHYLDSASHDVRRALYTVEQILEEISRRTAILRRAGVNHWRDLDFETHMREGLRPIVLIVDEHEALANVECAPNLPSKDPIHEELATQAEAASAVQRAVCEGLCVGVRTVVVTQRVHSDRIDASMLGAMRTRIHTVRQGRMPDRRSLTGTFGDDYGPTGVLLFQEHDDGTQGLALVQGPERNSALRAVRF